MLALLAIATMSPPIFGPTMPASTRREFQLRALAVEDALEKGDFPTARRAITSLPVGKVSIEWDDRNVPTGRRQALVSERDGALDYWKLMQSQFQPRIAQHRGQLRFSFVPILPVNAESGVPAGSELHFSDDPMKPQLEVVIGLSRGEPARESSGVEIYNEIAHGVGSYYGLSDSPYQGTFMSRSDLPTERRAAITGYEGNLVAAHLRVVDELRTRIDKGQRIVATRPKATIEPAAIDAGEAVQGAGAPFTIKIKNSGNAPLSYRIFPDCSCFFPMPVEDIKPGQTVTVPGRIDTAHSLGDVKHRLAIFTNDIDHPLQMVPFTAHVSPRYRFLVDAPPVLLVPKGKVVVHAYLYPSSGDLFHVSSVQVDGLPGAVTMSPWVGELADAAMNEGPLTRRGIDFAVKIDASKLVGLGQFTLSAVTDDLTFRAIQVQQLVQQGIAAQPPEVYFGELGGPRTMSFLVTRPGKPFKIVSTSIDSPFFEVKNRQMTGAGMFQIDLAYLGKAPHGMLAAVLTIKTDAPDQPVVKVPIQALVR